MAQGCWSVGSVCATSYSWTTGPHRGAMESPQTAAGTRDPATPMVAVQAENGSTNLAGIRSPGIGPDGRLVHLQENTQPSEPCFAVHLLNHSPGAGQREWDLPIPAPGRRTPHAYRCWPPTIQAIAEQCRRRHRPWAGAPGHLLHWIKAVWVRTTVERVL